MLGQVDLCLSEAANTWQITRTLRHSAKKCGYRGADELRAHDVRRGVARDTAKLARQGLGKYLTGACMNESMAALGHAVQTSVTTQYIGPDDQDHWRIRQVNRGLLLNREDPFCPNTKADEAFLIAPSPIGIALEDTSLQPFCVEIITDFQSVASVEDVATSHVFEEFDLANLQGDNFVDYFATIMTSSRVNSMHQFTKRCTACLKTLNPRALRRRPVCSGKPEG